MEAAEGASNPIPIVTVSLQPTQRTASISHTEGATVTFGGNVTVEQMRWLTSEVTLSGVVDTGWPIVLTPSSLTFKGSGTERFMVVVTVPAGVEHDRIGNVSVTAECKAPLLVPSRSTATAVIQVENDGPRPVWDVRVLEPADGSTYTTDDVTIGGTASYSAAEVTAVEVKVCTGPWTLATGTSEWTIDYDSGFLDDGVHTVRVRARAGEETSPVTYMNITQDRSANVAPGPTVDPSQPTVPGEQGLADHKLPIGILMVVIGGVGVAYMFHRKRDQADLDHCSAFTS